MEYIPRLPDLRKAEKQICLGKMHFFVLAVVIKCKVSYIDAR